MSRSQRGQIQNLGSHSGLRGSPCSPSRSTTQKFPFSEVASEASEVAPSSPIRSTTHNSLLGGSLGSPRGQTSLYISCIYIYIVCSLAKPCLEGVSLFVSKGWMAGSRGWPPPCFPRLSHHPSLKAGVPDTPPPPCFLCN